MVPSSWRSHWKSSPGSPTDFSCESISRLQSSTPTISICLRSPKADIHFTLPWRADGCSKGVQPVSLCTDKNTADGDKIWSQDSTHCSQAGSCLTSVRLWPTHDRYQRKCLNTYKTVQEIASSPSFAFNRLAYTLTARFSFCTFCCSESICSRRSCYSVASCIDKCILYYKCTQVQVCMILWHQLEIKLRSLSSNKSAKNTRWVKMTIALTLVTVLTAYTEHIVQHCCSRKGHICIHIIISTRYNTLHYCCHYH